MFVFSLFYIFPCISSLKCQTRVSIVISKNTRKIKVFYPHKLSSEPCIYSITFFFSSIQSICTIQQQTQEFQRKKSFSSCFPQNTLGNCWYHHILTTACIAFTTILSLLVNMQVEVLKILSYFLWLFIHLSLLSHRHILHSLSYRFKY